MDTLLRYALLILPRSTVALIKISHPADAILSSNLAIPLKGAAIGNGWIDSKQQYPAYIDFAVKSGMIEDKSEVSFVPF